MTIGYNIKKTRKDNNLTQDELAKKAKLSRSYISDIEIDRYIPSLRALESIADALNISAQKLLKDNMDEDDYIDELEKELLDKIKNISDEDKKKLLKIIEVFEADNNIKELDI